MREVQVGHDARVPEKGRTYRGAGWSIKATTRACTRLFGEGDDIGPDLTSSQRMNLDYLLENMLDPSAIVAKDYQVTILATTSGRIITGIIKRKMTRPSPCRRRTN